MKKKYLLFALGALMSMSVAAQRRMCPITSRIQGSMRT